MTYVFEIYECMDRYTYRQTDRHTHTHTPIAIRCTLQRGSSKY